jgi:hypothetical protein
MVGGVKGEGGDGPCMAANRRLGVVNKIKTTGVGAQFFNYPKYKNVGEPKITILL